MKEFLRTVKYALIAASAGLIELGSFTLLIETLRWDYWVSYLIALVLSVVWNFTLNRRYTFKSVANVPKAMLLVGAYYLVFTPPSCWLVKYLTTIQHWNPYLVTAINMLINGVTEFLFQRFVVFRSTLDTNELAKNNAEVVAEAEQ